MVKTMVWCGCAGLTLFDTRKNSIRESPVRVLVVPARGSLDFTESFRKGSHFGFWPHEVFTSRIHFEVHNNDQLRTKQRSEQKGKIAKIAKAAIESSFVDDDKYSQKEIFHAATTKSSQTNHEKRSCHRCKRWTRKRVLPPTCRGRGH